jgi:ABC-type transporter Mla subunit MlaD
MSEVDEVLIETLEEQLAAAESRAGNLAADLLEERAQRREVGEALARVAEERDELTVAIDRLRQRTIEHGERHQKIFDAWLRERAQLIDERDEARDEVVRLGRELERADEVIASMRSAIDKADAAEGDADRLDDLLGEARQQIIRDAKELVRLRTIIVELGAGEAAEPEEQIEALRPEDPHAN